MNNPGEDKTMIVTDMVHIGSESKLGAQSLGDSLCNETFRLRSKVSVES